MKRLMKNGLARILTVGMMLLCPGMGFGQEELEVAVMSPADSLMAVHDSVVQHLNHQIQELKLQGIMMRSSWN